MIAHNPQQHMQRMVDSLQLQGMRLTPQRLAVLRVLASCNAHPTAEQVFEKVRRDFPTTSLATIYNTLTMLKQTGHITDLGFSNDSTHFDLQTLPHAHLVCVRCKSILDHEVDISSQFSQQVAEQHGYRLLSQRLDFFGICPACQAEIELNAGIETQNQIKSGGNHVK